MSRLPLAPNVSPSLAGAVFLLARELIPGWEWPKTVVEALELVGAGKSQAYEILRRFHDILPTLLIQPGRPTTPPRESGPRPDVAVRDEVRDYLMSHCGAACHTGLRQVYSVGYRRFVVGLREPGSPGEGMTVEELGVACGVPLGTLKDWLRPGRKAPSIKPSATPAEVGESQGEVELAPELKTSLLDCIRASHLHVIATHWQAWKGTFQAFCQMLRTEQRLSYGDTYIGNFLRDAGLRQRRSAGPVEAPWSSNTFRTFFPGAQWLGDGTSLAVHWGEQVFVFNVEAILDTASNGLMGFAVSDAEDEQALRVAYQAAVATGGSPPLALTLDNRPSNHCPGTVAAVADTLLLRATPARGQAKAPLEGAFGLFQQAMPPLVLEGKTAREKARSALNLIMTAWARGRNGKPRKRLGGMSPAEAYASSRPTPAEIQAALDGFRELQRRSERARLTREARRDPIRKELLTQGLAELGIADPEQRLATAFACYGRDSIARGIAVFRAKKELGTLPPDANPGRYLGGIIRRLHTQLELEQTAIYLLEQRIRLRDLTLTPLNRSAARLRSEQPPCEHPKAFVDQALQATYDVDYRFWAHAAAEALSGLPDRDTRYHGLGLRIAATHDADRARRDDLIDRLAQVVALAA